MNIEKTVNQQPNTSEQNIKKEVNKQTNKIVPEQTNKQKIQLKKY